MIELQTFGALGLSASDGQPVENVLAQPKRALLLAYLACATPHGYQRRDVILALFWPELDAERARAALRQALHFLRSAVGDAVVTRGDEVAIDPLVMRSDVGAFEAAMDAGEFERALRLYRGDFLPGVFAKDAPDVERWIDAERARFVRLAEGAAWALADDAIATDPAAAAAWAACAGRIAPGDESSLRRRMSLLHQIGERTGALRAYDEFIVTLQRDYPDAEPSLETRDLRDTIAQASVVRPPVERARPAPSPVRAEHAASDRSPLAATSGPPAPLETPQRPSRSGTRLRPRLAGLGLAAIALGTAVAATVHTAQPGMKATPESGATNAAERTIAVMPFVIRGGRIDYLRDGMVDLLSISLDGAGELRTVEPTALLGYIAHDSAATAGSFEAHRAAALRFNAGAFVVGSIVDAGEHLEARAALYATSDSADRPLVVATASSDETHVVAMVDQLTRGLVAGMLRSSAGRLSQLAAQTTHSLPALKSYLRGTRALRTGQYDDAIAAFTDAVSADSAFALAFYGLSMARGWASGGTDRRATIAAQHAVEHAAGLSPHDSLLLVAHFHNWNGKVVEAEQEYRRVLESAPTDADAWHELGEVMFHNGAVTGHAMSDARDAFTRVAGIDALRISALTHLARIAAIEHDSTAIDTLAALGREMAPADPRVSEMLILRTFVTGDSAQRRAVIRETPALGDHQIWTRAWEVANYTAAWSDAESIAAALTEPPRSRVVRAVGWTTIAQIRAASGRPAAARAALARAATFDPAQAAYTRGFLASLPFLPASPAELAAARAELVRWSQAFAPFTESIDGAIPAGAVPAIRQQLLAAIDTRAGVAVAVPNNDSINSRVLGASRIAAAALVPAGRAALDARTDIRALERSWTETQAVLLPRSASFVRLARADLLRAAGEQAEAERWYTTFPCYGCDDAIFRAWSARGRARVLAARGDRAGAARADAAAAWLWRYAEPAAAAGLRAP